MRMAFFEFLSFKYGCNACLVKVIIQPIAAARMIDATIIEAGRMELCVGKIEAIIHFRIVAIVGDICA